MLFFLFHCNSAASEFFFIIYFVVLENILATPLQFFLMFHSETRKRSGSNLIGESYQGRC
jgi:hypothetical protein